MSTAPANRPRARMVLLAAVAGALTLAVIIPVTWFPKAPAAPTPGASTLSIASPAPTAAPAASDIDLGRAIAQAQCARCHLYYAPSARTADQWRQILPRMNKMSALSADDARKVEAYFVAGAK